MGDHLLIKSLTPSIPELSEGDTFIYSLFNRGSCIYVGQSANLPYRIYQHKDDGKIFDSLDFFVCSSALGNECEADTIIKLRPTQNKVLPPCSKYMSISKTKELVGNAITDKAELVIWKYNDRQYIKSGDAMALVDAIENIVFGE
jgi:hypothetical protein